MKRLSDGERDILAERRADEWSAEEDAHTMSKRQTTEEWAAEWGRRERAMSGHTKGPCCTIDSHGNIVRGPEIPSHQPCPVHAAAPDMLEALRLVVAAGWPEHDSTVHENTMERVRAIIRKATGEAD